VLVRRAFDRLNLHNPLQVVAEGRTAIDYLSGTGGFADRGKHPLPVLILLDLKLPGMNGHGVLRWLRSQDGLRRIPVVVLTTSDERDDINGSYDLGVNSYLRKPVSFEALVELLGNLDVYWLLLNEAPDVVVAPGEASR
jgi:CheY-like chemotaxis protein